MTLYLDVSAGVNVPAGLGRYSRALTDALIPLLKTPPALFYNTIAGRSQPVPEWEHLAQRTIQRGYKVWRLQVWSGQLLRRDFSALLPGVTLFHAMEHLLMPLRRVPTVLTVHDLIFKLFPEHHKKLNYLFLNQAMPLFVKHADAVIAISEATKRDLITHYKTPPEKITVVYEAAAPDFRPPAPEQIIAVRARYQLPEKFLLVVGTIEPRKNYSRLLHAFMRLREKHKDLKLAVVGSKGWLVEEFFQTIETLRAGEHIIFPGYISDADLPAVYGAATLLIMPSVYEGFGLPVLEGMACGTPVLCSNAASLPELGGECALYFDPYDIEAMTATLQKVLDDDDLRRQMRENGIRQAATFSWQRAAQETLAVYRKFADL